MANIRDIAKRADVSVTTVSRVINEHPYVSTEKRERVRRAMEELGYLRNQQALTLSTGRTQRFVVVLPYMDHPYYGLFVNGLAKAALAKDYRLVMWQTEYRLDQERQALDLLKHREVDGAIVLSHTMTFEEMETYRAYGPVAVTTVGAPETISSVHVDHYTAFCTGLRLLAQSGYEDVGIVLSRPDSPSSIARQRAYFDEVASARERWVWSGYLTSEDGIRLASVFLSQQERPRALFFSSDYVALGFLGELRRRDVRTPEDVAILGFDGHPIGQAFGLATMHAPNEDIGRTLFDVTFNEMNGCAPTTKSLVVTYLPGTTL
ncbi:LacI family DNA-binding transcriptional regulator [Exiguobacterium sp.]|uniref:LacI family DNA-binding transcriptional regulator n=1 Tax=Exiguobacterium sp. TaxID=44751 RepID=UPI00263B78FB|nr:LacI family DNA-binding transcriptional regulator [Exiguobacterium sp.]MCC5892795.1 LacI family DNA-binding transcriptional regulator [Exiguobacterium sp.]